MKGVGLKREVEHIPTVVTPHAPINVILSPYGSRFSLVEINSQAKHMIGIDYKIDLSGDFPRYSRNA